MYETGFCLPPRVCYMQTWMHMLEVQADFLKQGGEGHDCVNSDTQVNKLTNNYFVG